MNGIVGNDLKAELLCSCSTNEVVNLSRGSSERVSG